MIFTGNELQLLQHLIHDLFALSRGNAKIEQRQLDVFKNGQLVDEIKALEDKPDVSLAHFGPLFFGVFRYFLTHKIILAICRIIE